MRRVLRWLVWGAIVLPPILMILLSLWPADQIMLWMYGGVIALFSLTIRFLMVFYADRARLGGDWRSVRKRATLALCLVISILVLNWPMRIAFLLSRPAFNQAAQQLLAGESVPTPRRIGLFHVAGAELSLGMMGKDQVPALWTDMGVEPGGDHMGFVQSGSGKPPFIMWSYMRLDENWQFIYRAE